MIYPAKNVDEKQTTNKPYLFPKGEYRFMLEAIFEKVKNDKTFLSIKWICHDEPHKGQALWQNIPVWNSDKTAVTPWFKHTMHQIGAIDDDNGDLIVNYEAYKGNHKILVVGVTKSKNEKYPDDKNSVYEIKDFAYQTPADIANMFNGKVTEEKAPWE